MFLTLKTTSIDQTTSIDPYTFGSHLRGEALTVLFRANGPSSHCKSEGFSASGRVASKVKKDCPPHTQGSRTHLHSFLANLSPAPSNPLQSKRIKRTILDVASAILRTLWVRGSVGSRPPWPLPRPRRSQSHSPCRCRS